MEIAWILALEDGPAKTAAMVAWIQCLFAAEQPKPVLVGGAAVELYTGGACTTDDIDMVGSITPNVETALSEVGFERQGRHWVHEGAQVFVEFPNSTLEVDERAEWHELEGQRVWIISAEDLLVDRLGSWQYWRSPVDGVNALLLWWALRDTIDLARLNIRVKKAGWTRAWLSLRRFADAYEDTRPSPEEMERWASAGPQ
ncbi:MAG: hypothetical protein LJE95_10015 [Acidobacteria bacterium]|jgi:hypothetical protein|nr:hypothetical protein [Acidobacteriota bacterium]